jgi:hypothetical protein
MLPNGLEVVGRTKLAIDMMSQWAAAEFDIPGFKVDWKLKGKSDRSWCRQIATPFIQLGVQSMMSKPVIAFMEYKSFNRYLEVGGFKTNDWRLWLDTVIAHEMSHAVQWALIRKAAAEHNTIATRHSCYRIEGLGYTESGHGNFFLAIYKRFRQRFINDRVPREAYTAPRSCFAVDEVTTKFDPAGKPLEGCVVAINRRYYTIVGRDASSRRDYCWKAKGADGNFVNLKLVDICHTADARTIVMDHPQLKHMYQAAQAKREVRAASRGRRRYHW